MQESIGFFFLSQMTAGECQLNYLESIRVTCSGLPRTIHAKSGGGTSIPEAFELQSGSPLGFLNYATES